MRRPSRYPGRWANLYRWPTPSGTWATFKSKRVQHGKGGDLFVAGDLTIRGITREVTLDVEPLSTEVNDPWGNVKRGASARARINRKDFGVVWNGALDGGGVLVGDEVSITLEIELGRKAG